MSRRAKKTLLLIAVAIIFVPFPTTIARKTVIRFVEASGAPVSGVSVYQSWETFGLAGGGRDKSVSGTDGAVQFSSRVAYGTVASRVLGRLFPIVAVHASYGAQIRVEFYLDSPSRAMFSPPAFKQLEPFTTSGSYRDSTGRYYFPQVDADRQRVSITGDFLHDTDHIIITVERHPPMKVDEPIVK